MTALAIANQKGGVGKTTTVIQTAFYAAENGIKCLVIDMDGQGNASAELAGRENVAKMASGEITPTLSHQLFNSDLGEIKAFSCACGVDLIPSLTNDGNLYGKEAADLEEILVPAQNLDSIKDAYDLVLIDCPPSLGRLLTSGLIMSDIVFVPVAVSGFALDGLSGLFDVVEQISEGINPDLEVGGIFVNNFNSRSKLHIQSVNELKAAVGDLVFSTVITNRAPIDQATNTATPVWKIRTGAGKAAATEVLGVIKEMLDRAKVSV